MVGLIICWTLLCMRRRCIHQICRCHSAKWDTVNILSPIMPDPVLPRLYWCCPFCTSYIISSLSYISLVILHLFCFPHSRRDPGMANHYWSQHQQQGFSQSPRRPEQRHREPGKVTSWSSQLIYWCHGPWPSPQRRRGNLSVIGCPP